VADWLEIRARKERRAAEAPTLVACAAASNAAALALLMAGRPVDAGTWFRAAASAYRDSWADAPAGSWGRPIGALKALVLAGDWEAAAEAARWPLEAGAATADSPIGRYAAALALLVLGRDVEARHVAAGLRDRDDFPPPVVDALAALAGGDRDGYERAVEQVLVSFEQRDEYLEDMPVADTVLVLQALAERRELAAALRDSSLLPRG
jgi:hypothetical protein